MKKGGGGGGTRAWIDFEVYSWSPNHQWDAKRRENIIS